MSKGELISRNEWLSSSNGKFILRMRHGQRLELCFLNEKLVLWSLGASSDSATNAAAAVSLDRLVMQENGNLVLYGDEKIPHWSSNTLSSNASNYFVLHDDGNMAVYSSRRSDDDDEDDEVLWQSFTSQSIIK